MGNKNQFGAVRMADGTILLQAPPESRLSLHMLPLPSRGHDDDAGWDLYALEDRWIWPRCAVDLSTGWNVNVPRETWGLITARSSTFKHRRLVVHAGVIDPGYVGPLTVLIWNPGFLPKRVRAGERLAQLIIIPLPSTSITIVDKMPLTSRGTNNFGSTGR